MAADYVDQVAAGIVKQLREGTAPWVKPWRPGERFMPYNPTSGNEYRGMNAVWLMSQAEAKGKQIAADPTAHPVVKVVGQGVATAADVAPRVFKDLYAPEATDTQEKIEA